MEPYEQHDRLCFCFVCVFLQWPRRVSTGWNSFPLWNFSFEWITALVSICRFLIATVSLLQPHDRGPLNKFCCVELVGISNASSPAFAFSPSSNQGETVAVGGGRKRDNRSVITRAVAAPPARFNLSNGAVLLAAAREGKGLLMETHSQLIAGHYTTTGRDRRKGLNGRRRGELVNRTHTHARTL